MKSDETKVLLTIVHSLLLEACAAFALASSNVTKDIDRVVECVRSRGLTFFTLDLPSMDEILLYTLENGYLPRSGFMMKSRSKVDRRPRFLYVLWDRVVDRNGCLLRDADPNALLFLRQIFCIGKKLRTSCSPDRLEKARREYHEIESAIIPAINRWDDDSLDPIARCNFTRSFAYVCDDLFGTDVHGSGGLLANLDTVSGLAASAIGYLHPMDGDSRSAGGFKHGPGAVSDARSMHYKYIFPTWPDKLDLQFHFDWCGSATIDVDYRPSRHEPPSKLIAVPKTAKAPRLIASEPIAHQWCQQWVKNALLERVEKTFLGFFFDPKRQDLSQDLVVSASASRSLATLDLSSASDRVTCRHIEALFGANHSVLRLLHATRTRWVVDSIGQQREYLRLKKFAAMGSALTFPIQSIFFLCCALAACDATTEKKILALKGKVRVFGDDIIIPTWAYARLVLLLTQLGLVVNTKKSFHRGHFRESCGRDAYKGENITPVKPKTLVVDGPESWQAVVDTSNNLFEAGFWYTADILLSTADFGAFTPASVYRDSGLPGVHSYVRSTRPPLKWNRNYQRWDAFLPMLLSKSRKIHQDNSGALLQFFTEDPSRNFDYESGVTRRPSAKIAKCRVAYSPSHQLVC